MTEIDLNEDLPPGATPIDPDDASDLIPGHITTRSELNEYESSNISEGVQWAFSKRRKASHILTVEFCIQLHRRMIDQTWEWAGQFRRREVNIGNTPPHLVTLRPRDVLDNGGHIGIRSKN